jgi:hypothetical protein
MSAKGKKERVRSRAVGRIVGLAAVASFMVVGLWSYGPQGSVAASSGRSGKVRTHINETGKACIAPNGLYSDVWVTVTGVQAHINGLGWKNLTPNLSPSSAMQVDLLAEPNNECFLATLGVKSGLPAGKYEQIRIFLEPNNANASGVTLVGENTSNACAPAWNCVVDANGTHTLKLTSEAKTGLKIPSSQIAHGGIRLKPGQGADIDIDFNACKSIVAAGSSKSHHGSGPKFLLKPVLHANEIGTSALIAGTVFEGAISGNNVVVPTSNPTVVPNAQVWLEQQSETFAIGTPEPEGTPTPAQEQVEKTEAVAMTETDQNGEFEFCPAADGTYEVVIDSAALPSSGLPSNATITTDVTVGGGTGPNNLAIPLLAEPSPTGTPAFDWAKIEGVVSTGSTTDTAISENVTLWALQPFTNDSNQTVQALVPMFEGTPNGTMPTPVPPTVTTSSSPTAGNCPDITSPSCPANTDCECFTLAVPASNPVVGNQTAGYATPMPTPAYTVGAVANNCSPSMLATDPTTPMDVNGGAATIAPTPTLSFVNCQ